MGVKHQELERQLESFLEMKHVMLYTNGHLALENAIAACKLPKGSEVITTPFTFRVDYTCYSKKWFSACVL